MEHEIEPLIPGPPSKPDSNRRTGFKCFPIITVVVILGLLLVLIDDADSSPPLSIDRPDGFFTLKTPPFECESQVSRNRPCFVNKSWDLQCPTPKTLRYCKKQFPIHITMIGDSQMYWLAIAFQRFQQRVLQNPKCFYKKAHSSGCYVPQFFGFTTAQNPVEGNKSSEGNYGKKCIKLNGPTFQDHCTFTLLEYIGLEHAKDRVFQTNTTKTTQETIVAYLKSVHDKQNRNFVIFNTGLHDFEYWIHTKDDSVYFRNIREFISLLTTLDATIIWLDTTSVQGMRRFMQRNDVIKRWNEYVHTLQEEYRFQVINFSWDLTNSSFAKENLFSDNIHLFGMGGWGNSLYYELLRNHILEKHVLM